MKRKLTALILCSAMVTGAAASAADVTVKEGSERVTVKETVTPEAAAILMVVKSGADPDSNEDLYAMKTAKADSDGKVEWSFGMFDTENGELTDGEYDLYIKEYGGEVKKDKMTYASVESRSRVSSELKKVTSSAELKAVLDNTENAAALKLSGIDTDKYSVSDRDNVTRMAFTDIGSFASAEISDIAAGINTAVMADGINAENAADYLETANLMFENRAYKDIEDEKLIKWLCMIMGGGKYKSVSEAEAAYKLANILYIINNTRVQYIEDTLENYADDLGIENESEYEAYLDISDKTKADKAIVEKLIDNPSETVGDLLDIIGEAAEEGSKKSTSGSSGGGGGGGGSYSGVTAYNKPAEEPVSEVKKGFSDMSQAEWAAEAVNALADAGVVNGDENGKFRPNDPMTREEFVKMLVIASGIYNESAECDFDDVSKNAWYYRYIASARDNGTVQGISDSLFGIGNLLTRQDMAVLCRRAKTGELTAVRERVTFTDEGSISDYARSAVYELFTAGIVSGMGDGGFAPRGTATRAQGAMIIYNLFLK